MTQLLYYRLGAFFAGIPPFHFITEFLLGDVDYRPWANDGARSIKGLRNVCLAGMSHLHRFARVFRGKSAKRLVLFSHFSTSLRLFSTKEGPLHSRGRARTSFLFCRPLMAESQRVQKPVKAKRTQKPPRVFRRACTKGRPPGGRRSILAGRTTPLYRPRTGQRCCIGRI